MVAQKWVLMKLTSVSRAADLKVNCIEKNLGSVGMNHTLNSNNMTFRKRQHEFRMLNMKLAWVIMNPMVQAGEPEDAD